ncbi:MAG: tol-pal system protein YbgF [Polyangiaceae bacterium]
MKNLAAVQLVLWLGTGIALSGCAHSESAEEKDIAKMREDITHIQTEHDSLDKRIDQLELHTGAAASDEPDPTTPSRNGSASTDARSTPTPALRVVHLDSGGNADPEPSPDPNAEGERPTLQVFGTSSPHDAHAGRPAASATRVVDSRGLDSGASAFDPAAKTAYDHALALVNAKKYDEALDAFAAFLVKWPDHPNADNATYWRGECYFAKGDYPHAAEQLEGTIARFPYGNKVPDALLKLGATYEKMGDMDRAKSSRDRLLRDFPHSDAARRLSGDAKKSEWSGDAKKPDSGGDAKKPEKQGAP